jgi:transposase
MPFRSYSREQDWLLPPSLSELIPADHPVRFVAEFVDGLDLPALGLPVEAAREGTPAYHPRVLLAAWLYGFMVRVRSSRHIERACRENIPLLWLTGLQRPDHVTLWRFYAAQRDHIRALLKETVQVAIAAGLVDFVLQAVDGSKVAVGSPASLRDGAGLAQLLSQVETEIAELERSQAAAPEEAPDQQRLRGLRARCTRLRRAREVQAQRTAAAPSRVRRKALKRRVGARTRRQQTPAVTPPPAPAAAAAVGEPRPGPGTPETTATPVAAGLEVSTTDPEARLLKGRHGYCVGYNGQIVVDSKAQIVVGADVVDSASDVNQLAAMVREATAMGERGAQAVVADLGYADIADISAVNATGTVAYVPDQREHRQGGPSQNAYHKAHFVYDEASDSYVCPLGQRLPFHCETKVRGQAGRTYRGAHCQGCEAQVSGACTKAPQRSVTRFGYEAALAAHAAKMQTAEAQALMRRRKAIVEPVFGLLREQLGLRRFLVRGRAKVTAEWRLLCIAHNLRKLWKLWWRPRVLAGGVASG